jgi:asparagine synthase (glutamine-hydrolysing)
MGPLLAEDGMSVQAGIWNFDGRSVDPALIADFSRSLQQQGPDGEFTYIDGSIGICYRPFHTTAESRREKQPYVSRRGFIISWDGRLDNREELIASLRRDLEPQPTDVAIVAAAYDRWEWKCFCQIIGDWAVSVWDPAQRKLIFAVDYMAIRHIFYSVKEREVWWSTDLSPLVLFSSDKLHIDEGYVAGYFAHAPDAHLTPYLEIRQVPAGQFVHIHSGKAFVERFWSFNPTSRIRYKTDADYEEHFRFVFRQSVQRRLRSDSPILAELSGGLDSSSIVCVADDILTKCAASTVRLDTLSYCDNTEPQADDWDYLQKVEEKRGRSGLHIDASKLATDPASFECPEFNSLPGYLASGQYLEAERAAIVRLGGYRAVLSGVGGDEFLGGIPNPGAQLADLILQLRFVTLARQLIAWSLVKRRPWTHLLWEASLDLLPLSLIQYFTKRAKVEPWIDGTFAKRTKLALRLLDVDEHFGLWLPTRRSCAGTIVLMANKLAKWRSAFLAAEEARYPMLDQNLIEFVLSIPASQLLRPGERRSLMRRSLVGVVPPEILSRRTKQFGARTPVVSLEKNWVQLCSAFSSALSSRLGFIDHSCFMGQLQGARNGKAIHTARMLRTISLEFWLRDLDCRHLVDVGAP